MRRGHGSRYDLVVPGYKTNLSDVLAAIALVQLDRLPEHTRASASSSSRPTTRRSRTSPGSTRSPATRATRTRVHLYVVRIDPAEAGATRDDYMRALAEENISTSIHFLPGAPAHLVPRAVPRPGARSRRPSARASRSSRSRSRPPTARATSRTSPTRCAASTRASPHEERHVLRLTGTLVVTGLCIAYLVWKIDLRRTRAHPRRREPVRPRRSPSRSTRCRSARWRCAGAGCCSARGIHERQRWLVRAYYTAYTAGQVLPTSIGGDAMRIFETSRRHPGNGGPIAGTVLLERALGGAATLTLAAIGFVLAIGHYDVGAYLWVEGAFVLATIALGVALFSRPRGAPARAHRAAAAPPPRRQADPQRLPRRSTPTARTCACSSASSR